MSRREINFPKSFCCGFRRELSKTTKGSLDTSDFKDDYTDFLDF
jgi:hypothetical protein